MRAYGTDYSGGGPAAASDVRAFRRQTGNVRIGLALFGRAAAHRGEARLEAGLLEDRLHFLDHVIGREEVAEAELLADLEEVVHVVGPLLAPGFADGGEQEVRVAAHALLVEGAAPLGEHLHVPAAAAALDLHAANHLVDHGDAVVTRAAALAGVAVVAVPERVVLEQGDVAVEGAAGHLAR